MSNQAELYGTMSLGRLIEQLRTQPRDKDVMFDFCRVGPTRCDSSRGFYDHLAIGWSEDACPPVGDLVEHLAGAVGRVFAGYKGGEYRMEPNTPVWVDNPGRWSATAIVGVSRPLYVVIETRHVDL